MFEFIKKFFKEEPEEKKFSLKEFESWFEDYTKEKLEKTAEIIEEFNSKIEKNIDESRNKVENLEKAELRNPNIPDRVKQLLYGNKESYINKIKNFLENIEMPKKEDEIKELIEKFETNLDILTKSTQKSYMVMQEFLANESRGVAVAVNMIRITLKELNEKLEKENIVLVKEIKEELKSIKNIDRRKKELRYNLRERGEKEDKLAKTIEEIEKKIRKLEKSDEFRKMKELIGDKEKIIEKIKALENNVIHVFSVLEKSFKKFERMTLEEEIVKKYLENPIKALLQDDEFKLFNILNKMKESIIKGTLELRDKKKDKTIEIIEKISREYLSDFIENYKKLREELKNIEERVKSIEIADNIETLKLEKESLGKVLNQIKEELEDTKNKLENIDIKNIIKKIVEKATELTGTDIKIQ